jgi:hypothetical protein
MAGAELLEANPDGKSVVEEGIVRGGKSLPLL